MLCSGANSDAQAYDSGFVGVPTRVAPLGPVAEVAVGAAHRCVRLVAGDVRCWGSQEIARAASSSTSPAAPIVEAGRARVLSIEGVACAIDDVGALRCWGSNTSGALGSGDTRPVAAPAAPVGVTTATAVAKGSTTACAIRDGDVYCWGENGDGAVGDGTTAARYTPVRLTLP